MRRMSVSPAPVYVAEFDDGTVGRASFYQLAGKPYDFDRGARACAAIYARPEGMPAMGTYPPRNVVDGYIEHDIPSNPWVRVRDPIFTEQFPAELQYKRVVWKSVCKNALLALEAGNVNEAIELLRQSA